MNEIFPETRSPGPTGGALSLLKKILVAVAGGALLVAGLAMIVLPGPAILVIPAALTLLAVEFHWAQRVLSWMRERSKTLAWSKAAEGRRTKS